VEPQDNLEQDLKPIDLQQNLVLLCSDASCHWPLLCFLCHRFLLGLFMNMSGDKTQTSDGNMLSFSLMGLLTLLAN
jgi:hypothetical protein